MLWRALGLLVLTLLASALALRWQVAPFDPAAAQRAGEALFGGGVHRVVAVVAHPDDLEYYAGGTLARLIAGGARVVAVVATDGEKGGRRADLGQVRRAEQERAARILGYARVVFLGLPDRGVRDDPALRAELSRIFADEEPDLVLTFDDVDPLLPYVHPDHQAVGRAARETWPGPLLGFHTRRPDVAVDIRSVADLKADALAAHASQRDGAAQRPWVRALVGLARTPPLRRLLGPVFRGEGPAPVEWFRRER